MNLNYKTFGQGEPLLILHGLFGTLDNWQTLGRKLAEHYTVYLIDQRNHGRSPHTEAMNYDLMADDLQQFMTHHWIHKAHLLGHSMGGKTVMNLATTHPDMVDKLIVVDIAPKAYAGGHQEIFEAMMALDLAAITDRASAAEQMAQRIPDVGIQQFLLKNLSRSKEGSYEWKMNLPVIYAHYADILAVGVAEDTFEGDTLFLRGAQSTYISDADMPAILAHFPKARLSTIPDAGHWVHADQPEALLAQVLDFLAQ